MIFNKKCDVQFYIKKLIKKLNNTFLVTLKVIFHHKWCKIILKKSLNLKKSAKSFAQMK